VASLVSAPDFVAPLKKGPGPPIWLVRASFCPPQAVGLDQQSHLADLEASSPARGEAGQSSLVETI
jgi:hypothetical protein